jgi:serine/threonine protein kinase
MCAIKEVKVIADDSNSKECLRQLNQEMLLLNQLSHPNIVQYYGSELVSTKEMIIFYDLLVLNMLLHHISYLSESQSLQSVI